MKKLLLILLCLPMIGFGQQTYVPDDNFEQALINLGYDNVLDDYLITGNINDITSLDVSFQNISDLTGIEDFITLTYLNCEYNQLNTLNVTQNSLLTTLKCGFNQLGSLNVTQNIFLEILDCSDNQLIALDVSSSPNLIELGCLSNQLTILNVSNNPALTNLVCNLNQLTSLDVSNNAALSFLNCTSNQLSSLDVRNGNNFNMTPVPSVPSLFYTINNPNLTCINVDDSVWSTNIWTTIDPQHYFSNNCPPPSAVQEHSTNKELLRTIDVLGRETKGTNQPLFYIYDDGTVEKKIVIE